MSQLLAYQKKNLGILIGLLVALPDNKYRHTMYGHGYANGNEGWGLGQDRGCALGLAMANADKFKVPVPESERNGFQRLLGLNKFRKAPVVEDNAVYDRLANFPKDFARLVFGDGMYANVFDYDAFEAKGSDGDDVTKNTMLARLMQARSTGAVPAAA